jgi:hypothetical protein
VVYNIYTAGSGEIISGSWLGACVDVVANAGNHCSGGVEVKVITAPALPVVSTQPVTGITGEQANGHGTVVSLGNPAPNQHGLCWNTQGNPTLTDNCSQLGSVLTMGSFSSTMTGLARGTTCYVRGYATNTQGKAYGSEVTFIAGSAKIMPWQMLLLQDQRIKAGSG